MANSSDTGLNNNLFFLTSAFSRILTRQADDTFASVGLSSSHSLLLLLIHKNPQIQPSVLAEKLLLKPSTITRLAQKLERRGLVERTSEGRATSIACTSEGDKLADKVEQQWEELVDQKNNELGNRYVEVLSEMIANAIETLKEDN